MKDINLLPDDIRPQTSVPNQIENQGTSPRTIIIVALVVVVMGLLLFAPNFYIMARNKSLELINKELSGSKYMEIKGINAQLSDKEAAISKKGGIINAIDNNTHSIYQLLPMIKKLTPPGCSITDLSYDITTIKISGKSENKASAAEFLSNLKRINYISEQNVNLSDASGGFEFEYIFFFGGKDGKQ